MIWLKKCPFCAEEIQEEAIKCRYCLSDLNESDVDNDVVTDKGNVEKKKIVMGCLFIIVIIISLSVIISQCAGLDEPSIPSSSYSTSYVNKGDRGIINTDTYAAVTKKDMDLLTSYIIAKNSSGVAEMLIERKVFRVKKGMVVNVTERTVTAVKVKSSSGTGWLPVEFVTRK